MPPAPHHRYLERLANRLLSGGGEAGVPPDLDWDRFKALLYGHHVASTFAPLLKDSPAPEEFKAEIAAAARSVDRRGAFLLLELTRILPALEGSGCRPMVLKGPALSETVYPPPGRRFFSDLDILIEPESLEQATEIMIRFGYHRTVGERHPVYYERHHFHLGLENSAGIPVELHWDLSRPDQFQRFDIAGIYRRAGSLDMGGIPARVPSDADQLLHAAYQATMEGCSDLRRFLDAALLVRVGDAVTPELADLAAAQGLASSLWLLLTLAGELTGCDLPQGFLRSIRPRPRALRCLESLDLHRKCLTGFGRHRPGFRALIHWLCAPDPETTLRSIRKHLAMGEPELLALGYAPDRFPGLPVRSALVARQAWSLAKISLYQAWRVTAFGARRV